MCWIYGDDAEHRAGLTEYFADGLEAGERLLYVGHRYGRETITSYLAGAGHDPERLIADGTLQIARATELFGTTDPHCFDPERAVKAYRQAALESVADGYAGLRAAGEAGFLLGDESARMQFLSYELAFELMVPRLPLIALCLYDVRTDEPARAAELTGVHAAWLITRRDAPTMPDFRVWTGDDGAVAVGGEVDYRTAAIVGTLLAERAPGVASILDVSLLGFADFPAIKALTEAAAAMARSHDRPVIRGASAEMRYVVDHLGCGSLLFPR